jgi:cation:H+ antiporter
MGIYRLLLYLIAFGVLGFGSQLIVSSVTGFTRRLKIAPFSFSFFVLGLLTSITEIAVAINAVSIGKPEIFVGSVLGGTLAIFLVVIPLFTLLSGGVHIQKHFSDRNLLLMLAITATPALFTLDGHISLLEGAAAVFLYLCLISFLRPRDGTLAKVEAAFKRENQTKQLHQHTFVRVALGGLLVFASSRFIVEQTLAYSVHYHVSAFWVSLVVVAIGATLPEIAIALQATRSKHSAKDHTEDAAIGDFLGSAAANVLIFGTFTMLAGRAFPPNQNFSIIFLFITLAVACFYLLAHGKAILTRKEALALLATYLAFIGIQAINA